MYVEYAGKRGTRKLPVGSQVTIDPIRAICRIVGWVMLPAKLSTYSSINDIVSLCNVDVA